jgi:hypothetical protein
MFGGEKVILVLGTKGYDVWWRKGYIGIRDKRLSCGVVLSTLLFF